ncbi:MAG TPA: hypothetical protein VMW34_05150, partial [Anaerolineales bacterium]|nr:hypothetical protein [Anaerolineales bacterium]
MDLVFYTFALVIFVVFCIFSVTSYLEKEKRAMWISALITVAGTGIFILMTMLSGDLKALMLLLLGIGLFVLLLLSVLPIGRIQKGNDIPGKRFDERDVMFARARLKPGSPNYQAYYEMRPENQKIDDNTRSKPGLLSPDAKLANEFLFASPEASFTLTEVMGEMVAGTPAERKITLPIDKMTGYIKGLAGFYGALDVGVTELHPYHVYSHIGRGQGIYGAEIPVEHEFAIAFTVEMDHAMVAANPQPPGAMETAKEYVEAGRVAVQLAAAIRQMGYRARAHI